jgi:hypothetical protein
LISGWSKAYEPVLSPGDALDFELLPGLDVVLLTDFRGETELAFARDSDSHGCALRSRTSSEVSPYSGGVGTPSIPSIR